MVSDREAEWRAKYYPKSAEQCAVGGTRLEIAEHALRKWRGLTSEVLKEFHILKNDNKLYFDMNNYLNIDASSCSLCRAYISFESFSFCENCPLHQTFGHSCDLDSPYIEWVKTGNAAPMIEQLEKIVQMEKDKISIMEKGENSEN